jgi:hypothetical protein
VPGTRAWNRGRRLSALLGPVELHDLPLARWGEMLNAERRMSKAETKLPDDPRRITRFATSGG